MDIKPLGDRVVIKKVEAKENELSDMTRSELYQLAQLNEVEGRSDWRHHWLAAVADEQCGKRASSARLQYCRSN